MEVLLQQFQHIQIGNGSAKGFQYDTLFEYSAASKGVYAKRSFVKGEHLGELTGIFRTIYEVPHNDYLCFTDDIVLDYGADLTRVAVPNPLWFMMENEDSQEMPNVALHRDAEGRCWAFSSQPIWPGDELVYNIADSTDEKESWYGEEARANGEDGEAREDSEARTDGEDRMDCD
jgi:hypothetical protein